MEDPAGVLQDYFVALRESEDPRLVEIVEDVESERVLGKPVLVVGFGTKKERRLSLDEGWGEDDSTPASARKRLSTDPLSPTETLAFLADYLERRLLQAADLVDGIVVDDDQGNGALARLSDGVRLETPVADEPDRLATRAVDTAPTSAERHDFSATAVDVRPTALRLRIVLQNLRDELADDG